MTNSQFNAKPQPCARCDGPLGETIAEAAVGTVCKPCAEAMNLGYALKTNPNYSPWWQRFGGWLWAGGLIAAAGVAYSAYGRDNGRAKRAPSRRRRK